MLLIDASENPERKRNQIRGSNIGVRCCPDTFASGKCRFSGAESNLFRQMPVKLLHSADFYWRLPGVKRSIYTLLYFFVLTLLFLFLFSFPEVDSTVQG